MDDQLSLANLRDIAVPDAPSLWPPAPGLVISLTLLLGVLVAFAWWLVRHHRRNAYRRAGLALLASATSVHDVSVTLKRVALAAFPRERVASLTGAAWQEFLAESCPGLQFPAMPADAAARPEPQHLAAATTWIRGHRPPGR